MSAVSTSFHPGHLVMVDIPGTSLDAASAEFLRRNHVRAICLFRRNLGTEDEIRKLTADLREGIEETYAWFSKTLQNLGVPPRGMGEPSLVS